MSVRMAAAKLCACVCGGAVMGGGAVHLVDRAPPRAYHAPRKIRPAAHAARPVAAHRSVRAAPVAPCTSGVPQNALLAAQNDPSTYLGGSSGPASFTGGGYGGPTILGGAGGFGGNGFLSAGFTGGPGAGAPGRATMIGSNTPGTVSVSLPGDGTNRPGSTGGGSTFLTNPSSTGSGSGSATSMPTVGSPTNGDAENGSPAERPSSGGSSTVPSDLPGAGGTGVPGSPGGPPAPVPAPPMVWLFGAAAAALVIRNRWGRRTAATS